MVVDLRLGQGQFQQIGGGNTLAIDGAIESLVGTPFDDVLRGDDAANTIWGLAGRDVIEGFGGDDLLDGGPGDDTLRGGRGDDILLGGPGAGPPPRRRGPQLLIGGEGRDVLAGTVNSRRRRLRWRGNILIGGSTAHNGNARALRAILAEWSSRRPYRARIAALRVGRLTNRRLNGDILPQQTDDPRRRTFEPADPRLPGGLAKPSRLDQAVIRRPIRLTFAPT